MDEPYLQCAWCRRLYDRWGVSRDPLPRLLTRASHGLCIVCMSGILARYSARFRRAADTKRADQLEQRRHELLQSFLDQDPAQATSCQRERLVQTHRILTGDEHDFSTLHVGSPHQDSVSAEVGLRAV